MNQPILLPLLFLVCILSCSVPEPETTAPVREGVELIVLGIAQDAGFPQAGCRKNCCAAAWKNPGLRRSVTSLGLIDHQAGQSWLLEATPDFKYQVEKLAAKMPAEASPLPNGIFLTHAHIGHYTGLMELGREVMGAHRQAVYVLPRMDTFLRTNGPWSQLVHLQNIQPEPLRAGEAVQLSERLRLTPFLVPHRDEYSETAGFLIEGPSRKALFIPDIDKWEKWDRDIREEIKNVDYAFIDGTFFKNGEIPGRDMSEIPHPFVEESMALFKDLPEEEKAKIHFIHFNHTNPLLQESSNEREILEAAGFQMAREGTGFSI